MARGRSDGAGAWVAAVVLGGGFVITLILAILFYTRIEAAETAKNAAESERRNEQNAARLANDERGKTNELIKQGAEEMAVEDLLADFAAQQQQHGFKASTYAGAIAELSGSVAKLNSDIESKDNQLASAASELQTAQHELSEREQQTKDAIAKFRAEADEYGSLLGEGGAFIEKRLGELESAFTETNQGLEDQLAATTKSNESLNEQLGEYKVVVDKISGGAKTLKDALNARTRPDGHITDVYTDDNITISIGQSQRVIPGMTFEVFDPGAVVRVTEDKLGATTKGKASLEVVSVSEDAAVCRLVDKELGASINLKDSVVNLVYDPNYEFSFLVYGEFDIDDQGRTSIRDRRRVEGMISRWGGNLYAKDLPEGESVALNSPAGRFTYRQPELPTGLDFVVLGNEPVLPDAAPDPDFASPDEVRAYNEQFAKLQKYQDIVAQARVVGVPVLNQNRFLSLVGYYQR